jgi:ubiquinone/menaquinone biosynthesis C-methylase UbiE
MNPGLPDDHPSIAYYDSDYPGVETTPFAENLDATIAVQGLANDLARYRQLSDAYGKNILEVFCGSGRVALPLARDGRDITAVDISRGMLALFERALSREPAEVREHLRILESDARVLDLGAQRFDLIIAPFNGFLCLTSFEDQLAALTACARHLRPGGALVLDAVNPLTLNLAGDAAPMPFFTRQRADTGATYTRFAAMGPIQADQTQELWGWYDEIAVGGVVRRTAYSMRWRPIFRFEAEAMLRLAGLSVKSVEGGPGGEAFAANSPKLFIVAERP